MKGYSKGDFHHGKGSWVAQTEEPTMDKTIRDLQAKVERYQGEARFWKNMTGLVLMRSTLLLAFLNGAVIWAEHEAERVRQEQPQRQRFTDEVLKGQDVTNPVTVLPRLRYPAV